jgi:acyl dehydratase
MSLFYEDFEVGREFVSGPVSVTEASLRAFADLSGDHNPIHLDPSAATAAGYLQPVAHGVLGLALATGLASRMELTRGTLVALAGITWRFSAPVYPGDELVLHLQVTSRRTIQRESTGLVTLAAELRNQRGEIVQKGEWVELVRRRPEEKDIASTSQPRRVP